MWLRCSKRARKPITGEPCHANYLRQRLALELAAGTLDRELFLSTDEILREDLDQLRREHVEVEEELARLPDPEARRRALVDVRGILAQAFVDRAGSEISTLLQEAGVRIECEAGEVVSIRLTWFW